MGKSSPPAPPDPKVTASSQTAQNIGTAIANNEMSLIDQSTPWYDVTYQRMDPYIYKDPLTAGTPTPQPVPGPDTTSPTPWSGSGPNSPSQLSGSSVMPADGLSSSSVMPSGGGQSGSGWQQDFTRRQNDLRGRLNDGEEGVYEIPKFRQVINLPPELQAALDAQQSTDRVLSEAALDRSRFLADYLGDEVRTDDLSGPVDSSDVGNLNLQQTIARGGDVRGQFNRGMGQARSAFDGAGDTTRTYGTDFSEDRLRVEDAINTRLNSQFDRDEDALRTRLANQGISAGSEAYMREMEDFNRAKSDSRIGAVLAGGQEQSRLAGLERDRASFQNQAQGQQFNQNLQQGAFFNQAQQQQYDQAMGRTAFANQAQAQRFGQNAQNAAFRNASRQSEFNARQANANLDNSLRSQILQERLTLRNQPINEITAMMAGSQVQNPGLTAPNMAQIPTTDFAGITNQAYQNQLNAWQMQNANQQSLFGGILGLGSNLIMSDRRQKRNIKRVGRVGGLNVYEYKYVDGTRKERGYMADEVQKVKPEAVVQISDYLALDYSKLPKVAA